MSSRPIAAYCSGVGENRLLKKSMTGAGGDRE
jgi:hypothetical protein